MKLNRYEEMFVDALVYKRLTENSIHQFMNVIRDNINIRSENIREIDEKIEFGSKGSTTDHDVAELDRLQTELDILNDIYKTATVMFGFYIQDDTDGETHEQVGDT